MPIAAARAVEGPLERTSRELADLRRIAAFRRRRDLRARRRLRESDLLLDLVERCRAAGMRLVPTQVWMPVVRLVGSVDRELRDDLGIDRECGHVAEVIFTAQARLIDECVRERMPRRAEIIPLFVPRVAAPTA